MSWMVALLLGLFTLVTTALPIRAEATPSPVPAGCAVEHRSVAAIAEAAGTGDEASDLPDPVSYRAPDGVPADAQTSERVAALVNDLIGCVNAGDIVGFLSLFTDGFLRRHFASDIAADALDVAPTPLPADERLSLIELRDITVLPDGRIFVLVLLDQGERAAPELTSGLMLRDIDGALRIDEWQPVTLEAVAAAWESVNGPGYRGAIVPAGQVADYVRWLSGETVQGAWTPTPEQVAELEAALPGFIQTLSSVSPDLDDRLPRYQRHYLGYVADGHAYLMVNAFCSIPGGGSIFEPVAVLDGGDCFFYAVWDPAAGAFVGFHVNGEA